MNTILTENKLLCPSSNCREGAGILGIVEENGQVVFMKKKLVVNEEFIQIARLGRSPEKRFRFFGTCVKGGCEQWKENRCSLIDQFVNTSTKSSDTSQDKKIPNCLIRNDCRWFNQWGYEACKICPLIVTDSR
jgi:hypothetical protein